MKFLMSLSLCLALSPIAMNAQYQPDSLTIENMRRECDAFLNGIPNGLQSQQAEAVRLAYQGVTDNLQKIRKGRNSPHPLPAGVKKEYLTPKLCLFSPDSPSNKLRPVLLYLHGGGWAFGSINSCSDFCSALALTGNCCVVALDYRLAPEHPFPASLKDCTEAFSFLKSHIAQWGGDPQHISIGGDSAGGNLTLAAGLELDDIDGLIPIYPVTKVFNAPSPSWNQYAEGYGCDADLLQAFNEAYANGHQDDPRASVALASDKDLKKMPPVLMISAGRDILLDQGTEFAKRLKNLKVDVEHHIFPTATHLFITVPGQPTAFKEAVQLTADFLNHKSH